VIIDDKIERSLVPALKRAGATGIITYPLNKVIHWRLIRLQIGHSHFCL